MSLRFKIEQLLREGHGQAEVARRVGVSRQRVGQIAAELRGLGVAIGYTPRKTRSPAYAALQAHYRAGREARALRDAQYLALRVLGASRRTACALMGTTPGNGFKIEQRWERLLRLPIPTRGYNGKA